MNFHSPKSTRSSKQLKLGTNSDSKSELWFDELGQLSANELEHQFSAD